MKGVYKELQSLRQRKNKANLLVFSVLRSADNVKIRKRNLKKQSQFAGEENRCNISNNNGLWRFCWMKDAKKQSQTKPILNVRCGQLQIRRANS